MNLIDNVANIINKHRLGSITDIASVNEFPTIGSDGIYKAETSYGKFTIKFMNDLNKLAERAKYHKSLSSFVSLSKLLIVGEGYMVFEFVEGSSLLHLLLNSDGKDFQYYKKGLELLSELWSKTNGCKKQLRNCSELEGGEKFVMEFLNGEESLPIIINNENSQVNLRTVFDNTIRQMKKAETYCLAHGDAHLDNFIVGNDGKLYLIDLRPGFCWIDDLVVYTWQKGFNFVKFLSAPSFENTGSALKIDYQFQRSNFIDEAERMAIKVAKGFAKNIGFTEWQSRYYYIKTWAALCEIAGVQKRRRVNALCRDIPETSEYFWIAEAVNNFILANIK